MKTIKKTTTIKTPVERVFEYLTNPHNLPAIWPSMVEVKNVELKGDGHHEFDWTYKMAGIQFHGHAHTTEAVKNSSVVVENEAGIPSKFRYRYEPANGGTKLTMEVEYQMPNKVLDKLAEPLVSRINEREAETLLRNLKEMMEFAGERAAE